MKKLLLCLFLFISATIYSQVNDLQSSCDGTFNLTNQNALLIGAQNPSEITITFHLSLSDAENAVNPIPNPTNYTSPGSPQTIFARMYNTTTTTFTTNYFGLVQIPVLVSTATITQIMCAGMNNGSIEVFANGGVAPYMYTLVDLTGGTPNIVQSSNVFFGLDFGIYDVVVNDSRGCVVVLNNLVINMPAPLNCTTVVQSNTITMNATGGTPPYQYSANGTAFQSSNMFTSLQPGTYTMLVVDGNNCTCTNTVTINPSGFSVNIGSTLVTPPSDLFANVTGGTSPYTYQWGLNGNTIAGATASTLNVWGQSGEFYVIVTDANGLTATATFFVNGLPINANNDAFNVYATNGNVAVSSTSVLANDFLSNTPANTSNVILTPLSVPVGFSLNANGTVSVLPGTASGTYPLTYRICIATSPVDCDTATAIITVINEGFLLNAFIDSNNNGTQEAGEMNFNQGQFGYELNDSGTVNYGYSPNGKYYISESNPANSYDFTYVINPAVAGQYNLVVPSYNNISVVANSGVTTYNFPLTEIPFNDLAVYIHSNGAPPRPGFAYSNQVMYRNNGNQTIASGTLTFTKDNLVTITNVSQPGTVSTATGFTYDFTNILPGEQRYFNVTMQVPTIPTVALGNTLTNQVAVTVPVGDINIPNNTASLTQIIVGSYDPNDKAEVHGGKIVHATFTSDDYLMYTIQFENTGTANAENVRVNDVLDSKLDETSVKMIDASHAYTLTREGNNLNWNFNGIELPPSVANTSIGHGYITFQVKPKPGYVIGDIIPNTASIYFDFNPAIVTNTFNTEFVTALSVAEFESTAFTAYPNPTQGFITIALKDNTNTIDSVTINDVLGKTVQTKNFTTSNAVLDLSGLSKGIYFVKVQSEGQEKVIKVVKQ